MIRDAGEDDLDALAAMKPTRAMHQDRIREAARGWMRYLVAEIDAHVRAFGILVFTAPEDWLRRDHVPLMVDLFVAEDWRCRGIGAAMIRRMEAIARARRQTAIWLTVEPDNNARAMALYRRLGYQAMQETPFREAYRFVDSSGHVDEGVEWVVEMRKDLSSDLQSSGNGGGADLAGAGGLTGTAGAGRATGAGCG